MTCRQAVGGWDGLQIWWVTDSTVAYTVYHTNSVVGGWAKGLQLLATRNSTTQSVTWDLRSGEQWCTVTTRWRSFCSEIDRGWRTNSFSQRPLLHTAIFGSRVSRSKTFSRAFFSCKASIGHKLNLRWNIPVVIKPQVHASNHTRQLLSIYSRLHFSARNLSRNI